MNRKEAGEVHVVVLPWLAFGHLIPFLDLSMALAKLGIHVSYISTPRNIQRLPKIPPDLLPLIHFISIPLPKLLDSNNALPENAEATTDITEDQMESLKTACDLLQQPVKSFIAEKLPDWIIVDFFHHWAADIARDLDVPLIEFLITSASTAVFFWTPEYVIGAGQAQARPTPKHLTVPPNWVDFPSQVAYRSHEATVMYNQIYVADTTGFSSGERLCKLVQASKAIAVRSSREFEGDYFNLYSKTLAKPVFPLGFLPPKKPEARRRIVSEEPWSEIFDWLDKQGPKSVVFVGFGSEYKLKKEQIYEIAYGVELSGLPFLWALRKPDWASDDAEALPPGFASNTAERGVVQIGWAPQRDILAHPSIGGFLFHSGWTSIVESMVYGHCLILLPFIIAQPLDSRLLVEKGLAIEVNRAEDGTFTRHDIADALRKAMDSARGEAMRARAVDAAEEMFGNQQLNEDYMKKFVEYLKNGAQHQQI